VITRQIDELPGEIVFLHLLEKNLRLAVSPFIARNRKIEDITEKNEVIHPSQDSLERSIRRTDFGLSCPFGKTHQSTVLIAEMGVGYHSDSH
jgi:hypothetical protein